MTFSDRMKELLDQGWAASKDLAVKAGAKAQDLGERGILMLEIKQLEGQAQKLLSKLGNEVYKATAENGQTAINIDAPEYKGIMDEITSVKNALEKKETDLKNRKGSV
ncbi:MAG: hypothetical protein LBB81_10615 [Treponema sp.]|jgi:hypothetical protein|nr:hypothetical protein [Treponema sp.]